MPNLRPFRGLRYDSARDLSTVLCPPYDVISSAERERWLAADPANAVRLELPAPTPAAATEADYARAATTLQGWLADGTLRRDDEPLIYVYEQRYQDGGAERVARSFFVELQLEQYGPKAGVQPHERTLAGPREHRFQLLSAVRTHLSPVLLLYDDDAQGAASRALLDSLTRAPAGAEAIGPDRVGQRLWTVDPQHSEAARELLTLAGRRALTIADGHHRYETALRYRDTPGAPAAAAFVLALLYDAHSGNLALAPWQRVISGVADVDVVLDAAGRIFDARPVSSAAELLAGLPSEGNSDSGADSVLGLWTRAGGRLLSFNRAASAAPAEGGGSETVRLLDVSVLSGNLRGMIGATENELTSANRLAYMHDAHEAIARVEQGGADVAFLLRSTPVDAVLDVAAAGDFMPPKSTYFYPKAATGLVFDPLS